MNPNSGSLHSLGEINCKVAPGPKTSLALSASKFTLFPVVFHVCLLTLSNSWLVVKSEMENQYSHKEVYACVSWVNRERCGSLTIFRPVPTAAINLQQPLATGNVVLVFTSLHPAKWPLTSFDSTLSLYLSCPKWLTCLCQMVGAHMSAKAQYKQKAFCNHRPHPLVATENTAGLRDFSVGFSFQTW